ncbi:glycine receptor subunit alpha-4 [Parasteatoda tepidariorum]|nr:glycine receptor subunit alpha-4 isoform X1 [Parasteatoda tepidariorum]
MAFTTNYLLTIFFVCGVCVAQIYCFAQQAMHWEHQEMVFSKLLNTTPPYDARLRPFATKNIPVRVNVSIFLYSVSSVDDLKTDYTMQILYRETWFDERLTFTPDEHVQKIFGDDWHAQRIWTPDVHVVNDNQVSETNEGKILAHIDPHGRVLLSKRKKLRPFCKMEFYRYPMDKQLCTLEIESSVLPSTDLELAWSDTKPLDLNRNFIVAGFSLSNHSLTEKLTVYPQTGNFSRIIVTFELDREFVHFIMDIYIPSILFVVTSWLSFWVEIPAAPARVTLGMTTLLTLVTTTKAIRDKLPKLSYIHALDVWNVVCISFVFLSLVEYAVVNFIYHKDKRRRKSKAMPRVESEPSFYSGENIRMSRMYARNTSEIARKKEFLRSVSAFSDSQSTTSEVDASCGWVLNEGLTPQDIANGIDKKCRYLFPVTFLVFNFIYWLVLWV